MTALVMVILYLLLTIATGILNGFFSYLYDFCLWPDAIFKGLLPFLASAFNKEKRIKVADLRAKYKAGMIRDEAYMDNLVIIGKHRFFFKILGGCIVCTNIWFAMISFTLLLIFTPIPWWGAFAHILVSSFTVRKIS